MMNRTAYILAAIGLLAPLASASAGNAVSTRSSYVGPAGSRTLARTTGVQRLTSPSAPAPAPATVVQQPVRIHKTEMPRPTVSPYLNLFRPEASRVFNYYTLVRPQLVQDQINAQQHFQLQVLQQAEAEQAARPPGGAPRRFMHYGGYYGGEH